MKGWRSDSPSTCAEKRPDFGSNINIRLCGGIGEGTLGLERFKFWLRQDYVFLIDYARLLALAAARSRT